RHRVSRRRAAPPPRPRRAAGHGARGRGRPLPRAPHPGRGTVTTSAIDIAADVRAGRVSARKVVEDHLAAIGAREGDIHAFNYVMTEEARAAADAIDLAVGQG